MTELRVSSVPGPFRGGSRYNAYGPFLKERFGCRVYKVIVDAGFTCPNRDGTVGIGGCTYCTNESFRPGSVSRRDPVKLQVERGIEYLERRYGAAKFIVYFQPYTNTHAPLETLIPLYQEAIAHPQAVGISVGTRPDCMDDAKIAWFEQLARSHFVTLEYGLQSIYDRTLALINRGHDYRCWIDAMARSRSRGIRLSTHLILGFPWESREEILGMADVLSNVGLDSLKLHHLHLVRGTPLAEEYERNPFPLLGYSEYLDLVVDFLERLNPAILVERLFGVAPESQLVGPLWGKASAEIRRDIEQTIATRNTYQGRLCRAA